MGFGKGSNFNAAPADRSRKPFAEGPSSNRVEVEAGASRAAERTGQTKAEVLQGYADHMEEWLPKLTRGDENKKLEVLAEMHMFGIAHGAAEPGSQLTSPESFEKARDQWVTMSKGKLTREQINHWDRTQRDIQFDLEYTLNDMIGSDNVAAFIAKRDKWVKTGAITPEQANALPRVQAYINYYTKLPANYDSLRSYMEQKRDELHESGLRLQEAA